MRIRELFQFIQDRLDQHNAEMDQLTNDLLKPRHDLLKPRCDKPQHDELYERFMGGRCGPQCYQ